MKKIILILVAFALFSCINQQQKGVNLVGSTAFEQQIKTPSNQLIDVRTIEEFTSGHIKGAINIDVTKSDFKEKVQKLDKNKPVLVYCRKGGRSANAAAILRELGFAAITDLKGGITAWKENNKPIE